jgi:hypothetical protein
MQKTIFFIIILSLTIIFFLKIDVVSAANCASVPVGGNYTIDTGVYDG